MLKKLQRSAVTGFVTLLAVVFGLFAAVPSQASPIISPRSITSTGDVGVAVGNTGQYITGTDEAAPLFDPLTVNRIDLTVPQASLDYLYAHTDGSVPGSHGLYQAATMVFTKYNLDGSTTVSPELAVGLRSKGGWGSARSMDGKTAFKVKVNFSVKGQTLYGLKKLTLNNMVQDQSSIHEVAGYRLFRAVGVPSYRAGYARVYLHMPDGSVRDYGLHLNLETYDSVYSKKNFASMQHLYEGAYWQDIINSQYAGMQVDEGDATNKSDLAALAGVNTVDVNNATAVSNWWTQVQKYADMNELTLEWATERYIAHWDGYSWQIKNNYYVHFDAHGIASILPSGIDQTFGGDVPMLDTSSSAQMFQLCMANAICKGIYLGQVNKIRSVASTLNLHQFMTDAAAAISSSIQSDPRKEMDFGGWQWMVQNAINWADNRSTYVASQTNSNLPSNIATSYTVPSWKAGDVFMPTTTRAGTATPIYSLVNGTGVCQLNTATGAVTVLGPGWCRVSARVPAAGGYGASINYFEFSAGLARATVDISTASALVYSVPVPLSITTDSTGAVSFSVTGPCDISDGQITALTGTGSCDVNATVGADSTHQASTATLTLTLTKQKVSSFAVTTDEMFNGKLPKGGTIQLERKPSTIVGACSVSSTLKLKATGDQGYCTLNYKASQSRDQIFAAQVSKVALVSGTQTFPAGVTKAGKYTVKSRLLLAKGNFKTNWNLLGAFGSTGWCDVQTDSKGNTYATVVMPGSTCKATLTVPAAFGLKPLIRTWTLTQK